MTVNMICSTAACWSVRKEQSSASPRAADLAAHLTDGQSASAMPSGTVVRRLVIVTLAGVRAALAGPGVV
jgi:hypothetical protein